MIGQGVYHDGELLVQKRTGEEDRAGRTGRVIADHLPDGARRFLSHQSLAVFGSVDDNGDVWASVLFGIPGFMTSPEPRALDLDLARVFIDKHDPLWANSSADSRVGMLAIDLVARGRVRVNGNVHRLDDELLRLEVLEAYPNCPKYIQRREIVSHREAVQRSDPSSGDLLSPAQRPLIQNADTFFVASAHSQRGVDVSHRGGNTGFVELLDERTLRVPDYVGNGMYNTLGNFVAYPRAGLVFIDYNKNQTLQLTGRPEVRFDLDEPNDRTGGTLRSWEITVDRWVERPLPRHFEWKLLDYSPFNPTWKTGLRSRSRPSTVQDHTSNEEE